jgi:hypothetical protein
LPELYYDEYDAAEDCDDSLDLGIAEVKPAISQKKTEFSLKQFAKRMGQANYSGFNKWRKVWVAGFLERMHLSSMRGLNPTETSSRWTTALGDSGC